MTAAAPQAPASPTRRSRGVVVAVVSAAVVLLAVAAAAGVALFQRGEPLPGTTLGGVDVGGLSPAEVERVAAQVVTEQTARVLTVTARDFTGDVQAVALGVEVDASATAQQAIDAGRGNPFAAVVNGVGGLLGMSREAGSVATVDDRALTSDVERLRTAVDQTVRAGGFSTTVSGVGATATVITPLPGRELDGPLATEVLREALLAADLDGPVALPVSVEEPGVTSTQAEAVTAEASAALSAPLVLTASSGDQIVVNPAELAALLGTEPDPATGLRLAANEVAMGELVSLRAAAIDRKASDARLISPAPKVINTAKYGATFKPRKLNATVEGGLDGIRIDVPATTVSATTALLAGDHAAEIVAEVKPSRVPRAAMAAVDQVIGSFTTSYACCAPRARNIARMAELVDGTVVMPGKTFSLNEVAGERTTARGFYADGAIRDGVMVREVGGGVSQFSTTLFNAVWFSGVKSLEHKPHSIYISRYPPGREATLDYSSIDNRWRNDTDHPVVVRASTTGTSVTVAFYGHTGNRVVTSVTGSQQPRPGGGFRISVTRTVRDDGKVTSKDTVGWAYNPPI